MHEVIKHLLGYAKPHTYPKQVDWWKGSNNNEEVIVCTGTEQRKDQIRKTKFREAQGIECKEIFKIQQMNCHIYDIYIKHKLKKLNL